MPALIMALLENYVLDFLSSNYIIGFFTKLYDLILTDLISCNQTRPYRIDTKVVCSQTECYIGCRLEDHPNFNHLIG